MATYYVDSAAVGANNGSSWADAWVSIDSFLSLPPANNDLCLIDDGHSEDLGGNKTYAIVTAAETPFKIHCVDKADDSLSIGAVVDNGGVGNNFLTAIGGSLYCYGVTLSSGGYLQLKASDNEKQIWENCNLDPGNNTASIFWAGEVSDGINNEIHLINCSTTLSSRFGLASRCFVRGGSISGGAANTFYANTYEGVSCELEGVDLSGIAANLLFFPSAQTKRLGRMIAKSCKVPANASVVSGTIIMSHRYEMMHCESGTPADPSYEMEVADYWGTTKASAAAYRSEGATDKVRSSPYSWKISTTVKTQEIYCPHESPPIAGWTDGDGSKVYTYTLYLATSTNPLQDDEFWVELYLPNDADTSSQAGRESTRLNPQGTPANITGDFVSTWNGIGVALQQKIEISYTPQKPGPVVARCFLARASKTVFVDPKIYITRGGKPDMAAQGRSFIVPGSGAVQEGEARMLVGPGMGGGLR